MICSNLKVCMRERELIYINGYGYNGKHSIMRISGAVLTEFTALRWHKVTAKHTLIYIFTSFQLHLGYMEWRSHELLKPVAITVWQLIILSN